MKRGAPCFLSVVGLVACASGSQSPGDGAADSLPVAKDPAGSGGASSSGASQSSSSSTSGGVAGGGAGGAARGGGGAAPAPTWALAIASGGPELVWVTEGVNGAAGFTVESSTSIDLNGTVIQGDM